MFDRESDHGTAAGGIFVARRSFSSFLVDIVTQNLMTYI